MVYSPKLYFWFWASEFGWRVSEFGYWVSFGHWMSCEVCDSGVSLGEFVESQIRVSNEFQH